MSTIATLWFDKVAPLQLYRTIKLPRAGLSIDKAAVFHHNLWALALGKLSPIFFLIFASGLENLLERPKPGKPSMKSLTPAYVWLMFFFWSFMLSDTCWRTFLGGGGGGANYARRCSTLPTAKLASTPALLLSGMASRLRTTNLHARHPACLHSCTAAFQNRPFTFPNQQHIPENPRALPMFSLLFCLFTSAWFPAA